VCLGVRERDRERQKGEGERERVIGNILVCVRVFVNERDG